MIAPTLSNYLFRTRFFLRDSNAQFWSDTQLIQFVNQARADVIRDTACTRGIGIITLNAGQELYTYGTVLAALQSNPNIPAQVTPVDVVKVLAMNINWNNIRYTLNELPWIDFSSVYRSIPSYQYVPVIWSQYDYQSFYVAPIPSQTYTMECDCMYLPQDLTSYPSIDNAILAPWNDLVPICAAYWAKYYEQSWGEVQNFMGLYANELQLKLAMYPQFQVPSRYNNDVYNP